MKRTLTQLERLNLVNQYRILAALYPDQEYENAAEIFENGYTALYNGIFANISEEHPYEVTNETHDILQMFQKLEYSLAKLSEKESSDPAFADFVFAGFDVTDPHKSQAAFIIDREGKWQHFSGRDLDSHSRLSLSKYRNMLIKFNEIKADGRSLTFDELKDISKAAY